MYYTVFILCLWCIYNYDSHVKIKYMHSLRKDGDINWTERESSLKHHVYSNVKHKTKEVALLPDCRAEQRISRASSWKAGSLLRNLLTYSQTIANKSALFQTLITLFWTYATLQNIHTHTEKRVEYSYVYYRRVAGVFWCWVMTAWKRPVIPAVHWIH